MQDVIRVLIVDDDRDWREALRRYLSFDNAFHIVGEAGSKQEAVDWARTHPNIDVVLLDINLSGTKFDGIEAMLDMSAHIDSKFIMLTSMQQKSLVREAFTYGAINYITKDYAEAIPQAIKDAHRNQVSLHHSVSDLIRGDWVRLSNKITEREIEILEYLSKGYTFKQISESLNLEDQSIKNNVGKLTKKLGRSRFNRMIISQAKRWGWFSKS